MGNLNTLVPTPKELADWKQVNVEDLGAPVELVQFYLQLSADLLVLATGITTAPGPNTPISRLVRAGILDTAWYIGTTKESQDEIFSPFSSEHLGSYSYSKLAKAVQQGDDTGVAFFDLAVQYLTDSLKDDTDGAGIGGGSESVYWAPMPRARAQMVYDRDIDLTLRTRLGVD